jgi:hypothetical protein
MVFLENNKSSHKTKHFSPSYKIQAQAYKELVSEQVQLQAKPNNLIDFTII